MKILEAQSAVLTNYEVYTHLSELRERYAKERKNKRGLGNLQTIVMELMDYFEKPPSPLGSKPLPYNKDTIRTLLERLRPYDLTKAEIIMIMNNRPMSPAVLNILIQEFDDRFYEDVDGIRDDILNIVADVLGTPDQKDRQIMAAEASGHREKDNEAKLARNEDVKMEGQQ
ncbi:hypothetical protein VC83_04264 [Pseudogymnoascus destructans]|uniref:DNA-directed RNA polymerase III subunit RPC9 n=2 Tax=Pseudogymnoascus destructans TaxID=655981 RepID=L8G284_PSED2|nr:uncharacterized protein VC83_04264 [Pseudogymnoascus destructans]ELR06798.1 hypothetical protein GMDG_02236 [Pseudogymnoascus destructans 20631-21]OAF59167.1 hypothetical protein VC83_04264 [Pseudogymnoascus destructans]